MKQGCSVFVGNIDFDIGEEEVVKELSAVGRVVSFRLVHDKSTGKSKGYGFCEYESPLIAETAMKTLKISFNGRPLKINYAENDIPPKNRENEEKPLPINNIVAVLNTLEPTNIKEVIDFLKKMAIDQPTKLKELFEQNPNLLVAVLSALLSLKLIDEDKIRKLMKDSFDPSKLKDQISQRIKNMTESELSSMTDDVKYRLNRLKNRLMKLEQTKS